MQGLTFRKRFKAERPLIVAIAGGSASGKSFIAEKARQAFGELAAVLQQDMFYRESQCIPIRDGLKDFDCPQAFDWPMTKEAIRSLKEWDNAIVPEYNYVLGRTGYKTFEARQVIIFEGLLALQNTAINRIFDIKFFVKAPESIRLARRLERDCSARGIGLSEVKERFSKHVAKAHERFVRPQESAANIMLDGTKPEEFRTVVREIEKALAVSRTQPDSIEIESEWEELSMI